MASYSRPTATRLKISKKPKKRKKEENKKKRNNKFPCSARFRACFAIRQNNNAFASAIIF